jgi:hypothetical protein
MLIATREPSRLVLLNADTGAVLSAVDTVGDADDVWVDGERVYVTGGEGRGAVYGIGGTQNVSLAHLEDVPTTKMARTSLFDPVSRRLFLAVPRYDESSAEASVWVYAAAANQTGER